ncbi:MAG: hypothetical protein DWQ05_10475 [Calditrichaeota bacterium]|nr:MAG: hypothetical protein DWQ05_10475 [Calditrichota bacterium]
MKRIPLNYVAWLIAVLCMFSLHTITRAQEKACVFNESSLSFTGSPLDQAKCLLRPVKMYAHLGVQLDELPPPLEAIIGQAVSIEKSQFRQYLLNNNISESDIGGSISEPLSRAHNNTHTDYAKYLVIHDTSTPYYGDKRFEEDQPFPANINDKTWKWNDLQKRWAANKNAHLFINRVGESITNHDFKTPWRATKFEMSVPEKKARGLFLHIELIQPRSRDPKGGSKNDAIAPKPGFPDAQLERLALVYIAASIRGGQWMIPAFHCALDAGIPDAHDDPQNFDLNQWASKINTLVRSIQAIETTNKE